MKLNSFLDTAPIRYKLKLLKAISKGIKPNELTKSNFLNYLNDEYFVLICDEWNEKTIYKVNGNNIDENRFQLISKIASKFFTNDEYLLLICPKSKNTNRVEEKNNSAHINIVNE